MTGSRKRGENRKVRRWEPRALGLFALFALAGCSTDPTRDSGSPERAISSTQDGLTLAELQKLTPEMGEERMHFGDSIAVSGDLALIGAVTSNDSRGAAYAFERSGGTWAETQTLGGTGIEGDSYFGTVALSGNLGLVSGSTSAQSMRARHTVVFAYEHDGSDFVEREQLLGAGDSFSSFGSAIAVSGTTALVAAVAVDSQKGVVHVLEHDGMNWIAGPILTASDGVSGDFFGSTLLLRGDTALIGATNKDGARGAVYVFVRNGQSWTEQTKLVSSPRKPMANFGNSLALEGDRAVIGAWQDDGVEEASAGSAYVFERNGTTWTQSQRLTAGMEEQRSGGFGYQTVLKDDLVIVTSYLADVGAVPQRGALFRFERDGMDWVFAEKIATSDGVTNDTVGQYLSYDDQTLLVSSIGSDVDERLDQGVVYAFAFVGMPCNAPGDCLSGHCVDGVCCDTACDGACDVCTAALGAFTDGRCGPAPAGYAGVPVCAPAACNGASADCEDCSGDADCPSGLYCAADGACEPVKGRGATCDDAAEADCAEDGCRVCGSRPCVDGVCCNADCAGACDACSEARGASADGTCTVLTEGAGRPACGGGFACDGSGAECPTACAGDASCRASHYCTPQETCAPRTCNDAGDCNGDAPYCVDGICCDAACTGQCEACDVAGSEGLCTAVEGVPHRERSACDGAGMECGGRCDGVDRSACAYVASGTACGEASCEDNSALGASCDGQGACVEEPARACEPYACATGGCLTSCERDEDCSTGNSCSDGMCLFSGGRCSEDGTQALDGSGVLVKDCLPYLCVNGQCAEACVSTADCQSGYLCDTKREQCIAKSSDTTYDEGCGCRVPRRTRETPGAVAFLALVAAFGVARRRRAR